MSKKPVVMILSDATGDTASRVVRAALKQFMDENDVSVKRFTNVIHNAEVRELLKEAKKGRALVVHTFAANPLREMMQVEAEKLGIETLDLLGPLLGSLQSFLDVEPREEPGLFHKIDEGYFRRIDAVEFAVMHDDGKHLAGLKHADLVLVGLSRSGKTPLSVYLALEGWRVGNVPLVYQQPVPKELLQLPKERVIGLVIDPRRLTEIRRSRMEYMAPGRRMSYDEEDEVREEVAWCRRICGRHGFRLVDVTQKAIEETAHQVISLLMRHFPDPRRSDADRERKLA